MGKARNRRMAVLVFLVLVLVCVATASLGGDTSATDAIQANAAREAATAKALEPVDVRSLSAQERYANVQRAMQENGIGFQPQVALGDDGRLLVSIVPVDLLAR